MPGVTKVMTTAQFVGELESLTDVGLHCLYECFLLGRIWFLGVSGYEWTVGKCVVGRRG